MTKEQFEGNPTYNIFAARKQSVKPVESEPVVQPQVVQKVQPKPTPTENTGTVRQYTGGSNNAQGALDYLGSLYTSPQREEELRKASVMNQRIMAVGDALRHIGNIYNTVQGAPAQQFNSPVQEEYARYQQGKALRDRANQLYYSYQQQKAAQDAQAARWEQQFKYNAAKDARDYALKKNESDARANYNEARIQRQQTLMALDEARMKGQITENQYKALRNKYYPEYVGSQIARNNRTGTGRSGGGGKGMDEYTVTSNTEYTYGADGTKTGSKTTKTRTVNGKKQPTQTTTKKKLPGAGTGKKKLPR